MTATVHTNLDGGVASVTLDHPERRNALTEGMLIRIADCIPELVGKGARVLVLRGAGRVFCGGYDFTALADCGSGAGYAEGEHPLMRALDAIEAFPGPTVAALNGHVVGGGCLLAMSCDLRYARQGGKWSIPASRLGVVYPERGVRRLVALVGLGRAMQLLIFGDPVDADTAAAWGLVNIVYPPDLFGDQVASRAEALSRRAPLAVQGIHEIVRRAVLPSLDEDVRRAIDALTEQALRSDDVAEGLAALAQKRTPEFHGR
jgi:enoyl-CoA hydratase/carnithine racemase